MIWQNKNILITGATHFIAVNLAERLARLGGNVKAFIRYDYYNNQGFLDRLPVYIKDNIQVINGNLTNPDAVDYAVKDTNAVFHFGILDMIPSNINAREYLETTVIGTFNVLNSVRTHNIQKFIHISTAEVYGKVEVVPFDENSPLKAQSPHIGSDIGAEKLVEGFCVTYSLPAVIARLFNTFGPMQSSRAIVPTIINQILTKPRILLGDMHAIRDFIYVDDVVDGLISIAEVDESSGNAINLGSGHGISIGDLADRIVSLINRDVEILFDASRIRPLDHAIEHQVANIKKASDLLGWQPKTSLNEGLQQTIKWFAEHIEPARYKEDTNEGGNPSWR
jgi:nucleoside-diphosphate-sugar epimerase